MTADHGDTAVPGRHGTETESSGPRFDVVVRGYDRRQVDEHVANLERTIARQRTELEQAREGAGRQGGNGGRGAGLFSPGGRQGADSASGLSPDMISAFTGRLQSILQAAEEEAEEVRTNARNYARKEEEAGRARLAELERRRESMLSEFNRVRSQLDTLLSGATKEAPIGANLPPGTPPPTPPEGLALRGEKGPGRPDSAGRAEQTGPRSGPPGPDRRGPGRPEHSPAGPEGRPLPTRPGVPGSKPPGPGQPGHSMQPSPVQQSGPVPSPKPRPTPSPRPRPTAAVGPAHGVRDSVGRAPVEQPARNGVLNRENGAPAPRGEEPDGGRSAFGSGAR